MNNFTGILFLLCLVRFRLPIFEAHSLQGDRKMEEDTLPVINDRGLELLYPTVQLNWIIGKIVAENFRYVMIMCKF